MDEQRRTELNAKIARSLRLVGARTVRLRRTQTVLVAVAVVAGAISTVLAGGSAAGGEALVGDGTAGWRLTCGLVAVFALLGTLSTGATQQFHLADSLAAAQSCLGQLAALETALSLGSAPLDEAITRYTQIQSEFAPVLADSHGAS